MTQLPWHRMRKQRSRINLSSYTSGGRNGIAALDKLPEKENRQENTGQNLSGRVLNILGTERKADLHALFL